MKKLANIKNKTLLIFIAVLLLALPVAIYLVLNFVLFIPKAATNAQITFTPASPSLPPNTSLGININAGTNRVAFAHIEFTFDRTKLNLSGEITPTNSLGTVAVKTSRSSANTTGSATVALALPVGATAPTGTFQVAGIPFTAITTQTSTTTLSIARVQLVDVTGAEITTPLTSVNITLNPAQQSPRGLPTGSASPTSRATATATARATSTATARPTASPTGTRTASPSPSPTNSTTITTPDTTLSLASSQTTVRAGTEFQTAVNINTGTNRIVGAELRIKFDPTRLQAQSITPASFIPNGEIAQRVINNDQGLISFTLLLPPQGTPVRGQGTLANITFKAKNGGTTNVTWEPSTIIGAVEANAQDVLKSSTLLSLTITRLLGDINLDGKVNILDYVILFEHFGENPPSDILADIDEDGEVTILDYVILFENFGHEE